MKFFKMLDGVIYDNGEASVAAMKEFKRIVKRAGLAVLLVILTLLFLTSGLVITKPNEYRVIKQMGEIVAIRSTPGPSLKIPILQQADVLPKKVLLYDLPISDVITKDKKTMVADSFVLWEISDPTRFIRTLNGNVKNAEARISTIVYNSMKNVISSITQAEMISGRDKLAQMIFDNIGDGFEQYGIVVRGIETKHLDLPEDNKQAVYERMISERHNIAAKYTAEGESEAKKIRNDADKQVEIQLSKARADADKLIAEGESEYMKILSEAYNDADRAAFYEFVRGLDAIKISFASGDSTIILDKDSPIVRAFYNN